MFDCAAIDGITIHDRERRTAHRLVEPKRLRHAADKGGLATAKIALQKNNLTATERVGELRGEREGF
jgi:hypothetical protein